jgi:hypothetical protein
MSGYVYMVGAGRHIKIGFTENMSMRWRLLKETMKTYGKPRFIGCVKGTRSDESKVLSMGIPIAGREIFMDGIIPDLRVIFPDRECFREVPNPVKFLRIRIDPELMHELKVAAARNGMLMHQYIDSALRIVLGTKKRGAA